MLLLSSHRQANGFSQQFYNRSYKVLFPVYFFQKYICQSVVQSITLRCDATGKSVRKLPESKEGGN